MEYKELSTYEKLKGGIFPILFLCLPLAKVYR